MGYDSTDNDPTAAAGLQDGSRRTYRKQLFVPDGGYSDLHDGKRRATVYYWLDPETGAALYHTAVNDEATVPFFPDEETAMDYLEHQADAGETEAYSGLSLYKARTRKVGDAVDVLTDQAGVEDFLPDGRR